MDETVLLCEGCGYVIEGLSVESPCPECGRAIEQSLPGRRGGTAWERGPGVGAWIRTGAGVVVRPRATLEAMRFTRVSSDGLWRVNHHVAAGLAAVGVAWLLWPSVWEMAAGVALGWVAARLVLSGLSVIERSGLGVISRVHGTRLLGSAAHGIIAHGSVGWVIAGAGWAVGVPLYRLAGAWLGGGIGPRAGIAAATGLVVLGGFWLFEWFSWLGVRRLRYANGPDESWGPDES